MEEIMCKGLEVGANLSSLISREIRWLKQSGKGKGMRSWKDHDYLINFILGFMVISLRVSHLSDLFYSQDTVQVLPKWLSSGGSGGESTCQCRRLRFNPWIGKLPWWKEWQPTLVFLPGKFHGQRTLPGYSHGVRHSPKSWAQLNAWVHTHTWTWHILGL